MTIFIMGFVLGIAVSLIAVGLYYKADDLDDGGE